MSLPSQILQYVLSGVLVGGIYALIGLGFVIVYSVTRVINFAQGEFVMLGALLMVTFVGRGFSTPLAFALAVLAVCGIGAFLERAAIHPVRKSSPLTFIIITIGASVAFRGAALLAWGTDPLALPPFSAGPPFQLGGAVVVRQGLWVLVVALAIFVGLCSQGTGIFGGLILLDKRENTFCVPVNRASSVLAGIVASFGLWLFLGHKTPSAQELLAALLIVEAIGVLALPTLLEKRAAAQAAARTIQQAAIHAADS